MMMAFYMLCACVAMQVGLSYLLPKLPDEDPQGLYWARPLDALQSAGWGGIGDYRVLAGGVVLVMVGLYVAFR
jgi:SSS family solute:Na+ symporter